MELRCTARCLLLHNRAEVQQPGALDSSNTTVLNVVVKRRQKFAALTVHVKDDVTGFRRRFVFEDIQLAVGKRELMSSSDIRFAALPHRIEQRRKIHVFDRRSFTDEAARVNRNLIEPTQHVHLWRNRGDRHYRRWPCAAQQRCACDHDEPRRHATDGNMK